MSSVTFFCCDPQFSGACIKAQLSHLFYIHMELNSTQNISEIAALSKFEAHFLKHINRNILV